MNSSETDASLALTLSFLKLWLRSSLGTGYECLAWLACKSRRLGNGNDMTPTGTLYHHVTTCREKVAFTKDQEIWTDERLASEVERLAHGLVERGLRKGDRVALHMANLPELLIAYHACFRVGVIAAPLNIRFKAAELRPLLQRLRPALYIGQAALYSQVASIDSSILASNRRFVVNGFVNDPRVQPWARLFAEANGAQKKTERSRRADRPANRRHRRGRYGGIF
jgi:acyl-coenzyme A synthetase/AMP-(fatty) acid ligase